MESKSTSEEKVFSKKPLYYIGLGAALIAAVFLLFGKEKNQARTDFVTISQTFPKWERSGGKKGAVLSQIEALMEKYPEIQARYDAKIGQKLLGANFPEQAQKYIDRTLNRVEQPYYSDYARTTLLIAKKELKTALKEAIALKTAMLSDDLFWEKSQKGKSFGSTLFAFNLMRIGTLAQEVGDSALELSTWKEIKYYGGWENPPSTEELKIGKEGFNQLLNHFTIQECSLLDYISIREEKLSS